MTGQRTPTYRRPVDAVIAVLGPPLRRRGPGALAVALVALVGGGIGAALAPATVTTVGPFQAEVAVVASLRPDVELLLPPAGEVSFDTHLSPVAVQARISRVDLESARRLIDSPAQLRALTASAPDTLRAATLQAAATTAGCALAGALALGLLAFRRNLRRTALAVGVVVGVLAATAGLTAASFQADRLAQPRFTGLLSEAPYVARDAGSLVGRLESYRSGLADILQSVTTLYATTGGLPVLPGGSSSADLVTVLHVSDLHLNPLGFDLVDRLVKQFGVDVVVDTGDITTWGTEVESRTLSRISGVGVPYVFVRGNHDSRLTQAAVGRQRGAVPLDGEVAVVDGLVIAGIGDPVFTPDPEQPVVPPGESTAPAGPHPSSASPPSASASASPSPSTGAPATASTASLSGAAVPGGVTPSSVRPTLAENGGGGRDPQTRAGTRLADVIRSWDAAHPDRPVQIAALHDPAGAAPLFGVAPLVLAGHTHQRSERVVDGTRLMVEGSTGGAGITSRGLQRLSAGEPLPLDATLVYLARSGPRAGRVLAYDTVTVGGFGLASVSLERHVVRDEPAAPGVPPGVPAGTPSTGSTPAGMPPAGSGVSRSGRRRSPRSPSPRAG
jgi:predicted phosphodiesterase